MAEAAQHPSVLIVGSLNLDVFNYVERFPLPGETLAGLAFKTAVGGKGSNQAAMAGLLCDRKGKVGMIGCVGDDAFSKDIIASLEERGVDTSRVKRKRGARTGVATITVDAKGENNIILFPGANHEFTCSDLEEVKGAFSMAKIVVLQNEIPLETTIHALKLAKEHDSIAIFNPAPAVANPPEDLFSVVDIITPNETEAALLLGTPSMTFATKCDFENAAKQLHDKFVKIDTVIITAGALGAVVLSKLKKDQAVWISPPPLKGKVVDTTGAGDALIGSFSWAIHQFFPSVESFRQRSDDNLLLKAVFWGCAAASISIQSRGCQESYPSLSDLDVVLGENQE